MSVTETPEAGSAEAEGWYVKRPATVPVATAVLGTLPSLQPNEIDPSEKIRAAQRTGLNEVDFRFPCMATSSSSDGGAPSAPLTQQGKSQISSLTNIRQAAN